MTRLRTALVAAFFMLAAQPSVAQTTQNNGCRPLDWFIAYLTERGAPFVVYEDAGEVARAVAHYNSTPGGTIEKADTVILAIRPNGGGMVAVFTHGTEACEVLRLPTQEQAEAFVRAVLGEGA